MGVVIEWIIIFSTLLLEYLLWDISTMGVVIEWLGVVMERIIVFLFFRVFVMGYKHNGCGSRMIGCGYGANNCIFIF